MGNIKIFSWNKQQTNSFKTLYNGYIKLKRMVSLRLKTVYWYVTYYEALAVSKCEHGKKTAIQNLQYKSFKAVVSSNALDLIQEALSSNLNFNTGFPDRLFVVFFRVSKYMPE